MSPRPGPLRREPLMVALVLLNLSLGALLLHKKFSASPRGSLPPGHPDVSVPASDFAISGTVKLSPKLKESWPAGAAVFVIAREEGGGPPFAVRRYNAVKPPFTFALGPENEMLGGAAPQRLVISIRVDQDGDAMTRQLGDLESGPSAPVPAHASVDVIIDRPTELVPAR